MTDEASTNLFWLETPKLGAVVISIIPVMFYRRANLESDQYSIFGKTLMSRCELHTQKESHYHTRLSANERPVFQPTDQ